MHLVVGLYKILTIYLNYQIIFIEDTRIIRNVTPTLFTQLNQERNSLHLILSASWVGIKAKFF